MKPRFLKYPKRNLISEKAGHSDDRVTVLSSFSSAISNDSDSPMKVVCLTEGMHPIGVAWFDSKTNRWLTTQGFLWCGSYKTWEQALSNILVSYFG